MNYSDFDEILKQLRNSRELTQKELGARVGLSKAVVSKYENGMSNPPFDVLVRITQYFGVSTDYLLGINRGKTIDVSDLTDSQVSIIYQLIAEFKHTNKM